MDSGAHFHRCDFQVHSPRDANWDGPECVNDDDRRQYARSLIQACRDKGLDAIAITDHHDMLFARYVRDAARDERGENGTPVAAESRIAVFPGIELTLNVPCQAIVIFDSEFPDDMFALALNALSIMPSPDDQSRTAETKRLESITTLAMLKEELDKREFLRNRYIILPNVSQGGTDTLLRHGNGPKYATMPCVGGYLDGGIDQLHTGNKRILEGKASQYGNKRIALFQTSDNRKATHADLGKFSTWVKWAVPTAEALRQACLAQESRISQQQPDVPSVAITSLNVSNSAFLGPIQVEFNAQYNALIGGRGTGKSTILEYLRWGLCDQLPSLAAEDELPNYQLRRKTLIEKTLQTVNATVQVGFTVNGITHIVRRNSKTDELLLKVGAAEFGPCSEADVRSLLPIQAYSQKQLSNVSIRLEELSRFVEAPIRGELDDIEKQFERAGAEMRQVYATLLRMRRLQRQAENDELLLQSLTEQAANIRGALTGLSEDDTQTLASKELYDRAGERLQVLAADIETITEAIDDIDAKTAVLPTDVDLTGLPEGETLAAIEKQRSQYLREAKAIIAKLVEFRQSFVSPEGEYRGELATQWDAWGQKLERFDEKYQSAKGRATAHSSQLTQLAQIEKRVGELRNAIAQARKEIAVLGKPEMAYQQVRAVWLASKTKRTTLVAQQCEILTERSQGEIRASVHKGAGIDAVVQRLRASVTGSGLRRDKIDAIGECVQRADNPDEQWLTILAELETLAAYDPAQAGEKALPACPVLGSCGFAPADLVRVANKLNEDLWLELSLARLEDQPNFEFRVREGEYIPFGNASAGQQATALFKALLNQPGPPLVIDQPEEDLDNPVILEVVNQIWRAKKERQLIFASHNANLVVNGDAELVAWCDYRTAGDQSGGQVKAVGAIDIPAICDAIKQVMEGGEAAFKLRKEKYGF